ncbi:MAG: catalase family protein [Spongiibacteraceae bacterium]|nr:catalase family protein [Spongiibacteraceae bacterium]
MKKFLRFKLILVVGFFVVSCSDTNHLKIGEERPRNNEADITDKMISMIKTISLDRAKNGFVTRVNQGKSLACLIGNFQVHENLPPQLRQGLFSHAGSYQALIRFANASKEDDRDKDFRGMSLKIFDVNGLALWGEDNQQDFLLNSYPALFAANPSEFLSFLEASADDALWKFFVNPLNWDSVLILMKGREKISSPFDIQYWSTTPYRFGNDPTVAVKYSVQPCSKISSEYPKNASTHYLRKNMKDHLAIEKACFNFMVQFQNDPQLMPIEDASTVWDESLSSFKKIATLTIGNQNFLSDPALSNCEQQTFNPWQSLPEHQPIGGINRVRRAVYSEVGKFRNQQNQYQ